MVDSQPPSRPTPPLYTTGVGWVPTDGDSRGPDLPLVSTPHLPTHLLPVTEPPPSVPLPTPCLGRRSLVCNIHGSSSVLRIKDGTVPCNFDRRTSLLTGGMSVPKSEDRGPVLERGFGTVGVLCLGRRGSVPCHTRMRRRSRVVVVGPKERGNVLCRPSLRVWVHSGPPPRSTGSPMSGSNRSVSVLFNQ